MANETVGKDVRKMSDIRVLEKLMEVHGAAAAESISAILKTEIEITGPEIKEMKAREVEYWILEPAIFATYCLTNQVSGNLVIIMRQRDMQAFLNELMGIEELPDPMFEFDDVAMSAAEELMNQMVRGSIDAVAKALGSGMESSECQMSLSDGRQNLPPVIGEKPDTTVTVVHYRMNIKGIVETEFIECISCTAMESLMQEIQAAKGETEEINLQIPQSKPAAPAPAREVPKPYREEARETDGFTSPVQPSVFSRPGGSQFLSDNLNLIMDVPLNVSVVIGKTRRRLKDVMNFTNGTVVELDKQADAPVDIIVNGQLIARGEVVVIDDNFGVRISEIVNTKNFMGNGE